MQSELNFSDVCHFYKKYFTNKIYVSIRLDKKESPSYEIEVVLIGFALQTQKDTNLDHICIPNVL